MIVETLNDNTLIAPVVMPIPYISMVTTSEDGEISRKITLTIKEMQALRTIVETKKDVEKFQIDSTIFKSLMNKKLVHFSATFKYVVANDMVERIINSGKVKGTFNMEDEDSEILVSWGNFCA